MAKAPPFRPPPGPKRAQPQSAVARDFAAAVEAHNAGRLDEAERHYRAVLARQPRHADSLSFLGVLLLSRGGQEAEAIRLTGDALAQDKRNLAYLVHHANALQAAERLDEAKSVYERALVAHPRSADAATNLGALLRVLGRPADAEACHRRALADDPGHAVAHLNLAAALTDLNRKPEAMASLVGAIRLNPSLVEAHQNLGTLLMEAGRWRDAITALTHAQGLAPARADLQSALGSALLGADRLMEAVTWQRRAVASAPDNADYRFNLGNSLVALDRAREAAAAFQEALRLRPSHFAAATNLSHALAQFATPAEREALLTEAAEAGKLAAARFSRGVLRLEQGRLTQGWPDYDARFAGELARHGRRLDVPLWQGADIPNRTVLIWREQGIGDEIMFATALAHLARRHARMRFVFECTGRLEGLFVRAFADLPNLEVRVETAGDAGADMHRPLGGVSSLLRARLSAFADTGLPLRPDLERVAMWGPRLASLPPGLRVGLCWRSRLATRDRKASYLSAPDLAPLIAVPGIQWVNLQAGLEPAESAVFDRLGRCLHRWDDLDLVDDLEGLAALSAQLDLVISAPTAVAEMAAAVGTPTWRLAPGRDWTSLGTAVRPWYPAQRLVVPPQAASFAQLPGHVAALLAALRLSIGSVTGPRIGAQ
ncbi:tetratricopeptide repeat protein [Nitrospirillum iridis]|uniref:Tetratricopeptide (TPR) repeat protein n=1 Tax=Nitrospirillum iridis TaxID=765888 RepID=A0A7X0EF60_9PROT|nr:tetratricopeptide repeat protein [Nitrospirillum iridis]MBB6254652.1 tetratricopeptide (TPR) repeat protein [Nitrospirillum iridis]